ncbi:hypothetical protein E1264_18500 [Actinomadura sp. KC216]|uniref:hypothetical protein n=1 Tax=Actinomadura sp. KC216 TaxID=2530370 RepID=UPI001049B109|nr:hypothetical protein [Actinomadura sp. KC216]TDB86284.1 hypothetical protein E1264_18500 [Actinomadura sp. KC216]
MRYFDWATDLGLIDWVQVASAFFSAVAAGLALIAIVQAGKAATENQEAMIRERRIDFELDVLTQILTEMAYMTDPGSRPKIKLLAAVLPVETVPLTRAVFQLESEPNSVEEARDYGYTAGGPLPDALLERIREECTNSVQANLRERALSSPRHRILWWRGRPA